MEKRKHIVILAAGDFPTHEEPLSAFREAEWVVCCDSAYEGYIGRGMDDGRCTVVGDGDSLPAALRESLQSRFVRVGEQNYNDLHKAMVYVVERWGREALAVHIVGATGRREDHTLGNIGYIAEFQEEYPNVEIEMITDYGCFTAFRGHRRYASRAGQQVSLFVDDPRCPVTSRGLRYPLEAMRVPRMWRGTLNEALGDSFELFCEGWVTVFQTHPTNSSSSSSS